ncbi:MAG: hypothetical protein LIR25_08845 [bacterium]|nr:hypothetical protein [bacterium]
MVGASGLVPQPVEAVSAIKGKREASRLRTPASGKAELSLRNNGILAARTASVDKLSATGYGYKRCDLINVYDGFSYSDGPLRISPVGRGNNGLFSI